VKRFILVITIIVTVAAAKEGGTRLSHDEQGRAVISLDEDTRRDAGITVTNPVVGQWSQEVKGYGRALDPAPLMALMNELASAQAAAAASSREFDRQKILSAQNNASARALQNSEAAAQHDHLAVQSARDRVTLAWGQIPGPDFVQLLTDRKAILVRIDLPGGEALETQPPTARLVTLSGKTAEAKFFAPATTVDPQFQGQGFIFSVQPNSAALEFGQPLTAWLQLSGKALAGVIIPRDAVVRTEGAGWVYAQNKDGKTFTRTKIPLDRPAPGGWFVTDAIKADDAVVATGAQTLLSEELKAALAPD
jgi:hypothetical protein